jgi:hypothetical protein
MVCDGTLPFHLGGSRNEEAADINGFGGAARRGGGLPRHRLHVARRTVPAERGASGDLSQRVFDLHCSLRPVRRHGRSRPGRLRARDYPLIGRRPVVKKLLLLTTLGAMLAGTAGCHFAECWTYAWNSRFHPERNANLCQPQCAVTEPYCDPCGGGTVVTTPTTSGCGCGGAPTVSPGPIVTH